MLITHHHFDHIGALQKIENYFNIKENVCSVNLGWEIVNTPGHTKDSVSYYFKDEKILFCGDFIFLNSIGRTDMDTGSDIDMQNSLKLISNYDDDIIIYPGHGEKTILGYEKNNFKYYYK